MAQILVVDDEYPIREWLTHIIHSARPEYGVTGAKNGLDALEKMKETIFDVIITDIRMPYMDGLELLKEIRTANPQARVIVLSSYDDYNYVRSAFKNDAMDYMLKAEIDEEKLLEAIDSYQTQKNQSPDLSEMASQIAMAICENTIDKEEFLQELSSYGDFVPQKCYYCFLMKICTDEKECRPFLPSTEDTKLKFCLPVSSGLYMGCVEIIQQPSLLIQLQRQSMYNRQLQRYNALALFISSDIRQEALGLLDCLRALYTFRNVDFYGLSVYRPAKPLADHDLQVKDRYLRIINAIYKNDREDMHRQINDFFRFLKETIYPNVEEVKFMCMKLCEIFYFSRHTTDLNGYHQYTEDLSPRILSAKTADELWHQLGEALEKLYQPSALYNNYSPRISQAVALIEKTYMESITLVSVAQALHISPEYLSRSFKKEVGTNFNTYLNNIRLQHALTLLKESDSLVAEIAEQTGFQTPAYFSKCFKASFGVSPLEWKLLSTTAVPGK